jgi:Tfp pilus assembly protein PilF
MRAVFIEEESTATRDGDAAAAETTFREAIHFAPKVARFRYNLGTFLVQRERYRDGSREMTRAIDRGWKDADAYVDRAVARWKLGKLADARRDFEEALRLEPGNRDAVANLLQRLAALWADPAGSVNGVCAPIWS